MRARSRRLVQACAGFFGALALATCTDNTGPTSEPAFFVTPTGLETVNPPQVFVGAGDIATCGSNNDAATATLLDNIPGTVFTIGDNSYPSGTSSEFTNCYEPTWGRHKARTRPVPGNHDYDTPGGSGYFGYFGAAAGTPGQGYYSYDLGQWHIITLNSEIARTPSSPQMQWLRADLAAHTNLCTLALWHEPLYSSGASDVPGGLLFSSNRPFWDTLYTYGADLVLNGHRHNYERLAPMKPNGTADPTFGIRALVAGMGGIGGASFTSINPLSEERNGNTFGVLKLYLYDDSYAWKFVPVAGKTYTDSGSTACHPRPGSQTPVPTALAFTVQPSTTASGAAITPAVQVEIRDQFGARVTSATNSVTLAIGANPASGTLSGTTTVAAVSGVATFANLSINNVGTGYTLTAAATGLTGATSAAFDISAAPPVATSLAFTVQPSNTVAGAAIAPAVQVEVRDQYGARLTGATNGITLAIGTNPGNGTLGGTASAAAVNGVATFADLTINNTGTGYTLTASASGLTGATSTPFDITAAPPVATSLAFTAQPSSALTDAAITPAVQVEIRDQFGVRMTGATNSITMAIGTNPGSGTLSGTTPVAAVNGVASFADLSINHAGTGYTLVASASGLPDATSNAFNITAAPVATTLNYKVQPSNTLTGAAITPAVEVEILDQFGARLTSATNSVTLAIDANPGSGTLGGTTTVAAVSGVATFANLSINNAGTGYTLAASASGLTGATSAAFNITPAPPSASQSTVQAAPTGLTASSGGSASTITVTAKDANGNAVSGATVVLAATGTGNTLTQPSGATDGSGVATGTLSSTVAESKTVSATIAGVAITQTATVTVSAGPADAAQSTVTALPASIQAGGGSSTITVTVKDAFGNPRTGSTVVLAASGTGNSLTQPGGTTNGSGVATGSLSSTVAETKTVSATADGTALSQTAPVTVTSPPPGITHTLLTAGTVLTNQNVYTTAAIAPAPNTLVTLVLLSHRATATISPTVSGGGLTWTLVTSVDFDTLSLPHRRLSIYRAMSATPGSGPISFSFTNQVSNLEWIVSQWSGVETSGVNGAGAIGQLGSARADAINGLSVGLGPLGGAANVVLGAFGVNAQVVAVTPGAGFTEISEQPANEGTRGDLQAQWAVNQSTSSASWPNLKGGALAVELKAATGP